MLLIKDLVNIERLKAVSFTEEIENSNLGIIKGASSHMSIIVIADRLIMLINATWVQYYICF